MMAFKNVLAHPTHPQSTDATAVVCNMAIETEDDHTPQPSVRKPS